MKKKPFLTYFVYSFLIAAIFFFARPVFAEIVPDYHKEVLDNGTVVVGCYMPDSPLVTIQLRVLSGLSNEGEYAGTGISHFIEHMIFRAVAEDGNTPARKIIKAMGGSMNGSTGQDSAEYHVTVPKEHFQEAMKLIVRMVMEPVFDDEGIRMERDVIFKEMNMVDDEPERKQIRLLFENAFRRHVYKYPIIGYPELFSEIQKQDLEKYHSAVYVPDRVVLGVAGGVPPEKVFLLARECFSEYPRSKPWEASVVPEPRQLTPGTVVFGEDVEIGYIAIGFHSISLYSPHLYPVNVLSVILGDGEDSLLHRILVKEKQLLHSVQAFNMNPAYPGLFVVMGTGETEDLEEARGEIFNVISDLAGMTLREDDLETAQNNVIFSYFSAHESTYGVVAAMTSAAIFTGDPSFLKSYMEGIKRVTPEEVTASAKEYLKEDNSTTVYIVPEIHTGDFALDLNKSVLKKEESVDISEKTLKNGLHLIAKRTGALPLVSVTFASRGGLMAEDKENNGISSLTAALLLKGTAKRKDKDIVPAIERMGGNISAFSGLNSIGLSMNLLSEDIEPGMKIFRDVVLNPSFPDEEVEKEKIKVVARIREQKKDIFAVGILGLRGLLYGEHPYSMRTTGEIEIVEKLNNVGLSDFYKKIVCPESSVICVAGDINPEETIERLSGMFSSWRRKSPSGGEKKHLQARAWVEETIAMKKQQSLVALGFRGVTVQDSRKYDLDVISALLSGSDGILFDRIREGQGMAYTSGAANVPHVDEGYFVLYAATTNENLENSRGKILGAIDAVIAGEVTDEEIASSKKRIAADYARSIEGNAAISMTMALNTLYGLGSLHHESYDDNIAGVKRADIIKTAGDILDPQVAAVIEIRSDL